MNIFYQNRNWDVVKVGGADVLDETMAGVAVRVAMASRESLICFKMTDLSVMVREA